MQAIRKAIFWLHLAIGILAGGVILVMAVTGVLMSFERQITSVADGFHITPPSGVPLLGPEILLEKHPRHEPAPSTIGFERDPSTAVSYQFGRERVVFKNPYTGKSVGEGNTTVRGFFRSVLSLHRWLGQEGATRPIGKTIIGVGNLLFLFLLISGAYLWFPRRWTRSGVKSATLYQKKLSGRARDWNLHNVFGFWTAIPLLVIVACGTVISHQWANDLVFRMAGEKPAPRSDRKKPTPPPLPNNLTGLDAALATVKAANPGWQSIQLQLPFTATVAFVVSDSHRGRPDKQRRVTVDLATSEILKTECFADLSPGRQARTWIRWVHTGEAGGPAGQTIAGLSAASAIVLVWTGFSLSWRRFRRKMSFR